MNCCLEKLSLQFINFLHLYKIINCHSLNCFIIASIFRRPHLENDISLLIQIARERYIEVWWDTMYDTIVLILILLLLLIIVLILLLLLLIIIYPSSSLFWCLQCISNQRMRSYAYTVVTNSVNSIIFPFCYFQRLFLSYQSVSCWCEFVRQEHRRQSRSDLLSWKVLEQARHGYTTLVFIKTQISWVVLDFDRDLPAKQNQNLWIYLGILFPNVHQKESFSFGDYALPQI